MASEMAKFLFLRGEGEREVLSVIRLFDFDVIKLRFNQGILQGNCRGKRLMSLSPKTRTGNLFCSNSLFFKRERVEQDNGE